jgi:hypothetical protein
MEDKDFLLKCCYELLRKQSESRTVLNLTREVVIYNGEICDGSYIMKQIAEIYDL